MPRRAARRRKAADHVEARAQIDGRRREPPACDQIGEVADDLPRLRRQIELDRHAGIEVNAVEHARECGGRRVEAETAGARSAGEHQEEAGRAIFEVRERLGIGRRRIGMIDPLHQCPRCLRRASRHRRRGRCALVQRRDGWAVIRRAEQPLERRAFERGIDQLAPLLAGRGREIGGERRGFGLGVHHRRKMPCPTWGANRDPVEHKGQFFRRDRVPVPGPGAIGMPIGHADATGHYY